MQENAWDAHQARPAQRDIKKSGPILLVEDDKEDQEIITQILKDARVKNRVVVFENGADAYEYLINEAHSPFLILCDIKIPIIDGIELRKKIYANEGLRKKSIPFVFLTTLSEQRTIDRAYDLTVQGYFTKPANFDDFHRLIHATINYWDICLHPSQ